MLPDWIPGRITGGDLAAISYLLLLVGIGLIVGIVKFIKEGSRG
jgi:hypothetical protein